MATITLIRTPIDYINSLKEPGKSWLVELLEYLDTKHPQLVSLMYRQRPMYKVGSSYLYITVSQSFISIHSIDEDILAEMKRVHPKARIGKQYLKLKLTEPETKPIMYELCDSIVKKHGRAAQKRNGKYNSVDEYILMADPKARNALHAIRERILTIAPTAEEGIRYNIPAYKLGGQQIANFSVNNESIGLRAGESCIAYYKEKLMPYKHTKDTVSFPLSRSMPLDIIDDMIRFNSRNNAKEATQPAF